MTITAEIKAGCTAERFRAYAQAPMTRKPRLEDHKAMVRLGKEFAPRQKVAYTVHEPQLAGDVSGDKLAIDSGETVITHVAFYAGPVEEEVVVGSVEVNAAGAIEIELAEEKDDTPKPVSEEELKG